MAENRTPAFTRLEQAIGGDLARLLVGALSGSIRRGTLPTRIVPLRDQRH